MFSVLFGDAALTPHGFCLSWEPSLMALHAVSDLAIGVAYFSIPLVLAVFVIRRRDLAFRGVFWLFACFILACGSTHFLGVWTLWHPDYVTEGVVKAATAVLSLLTAIQLWPLLPQALALPSPAALRRANSELERQVRERDAAVAALQREQAERERAEAMLRQAQKLEAIGQLTSGVAHDFNNLLTVVVANLELLDNRLGPEPALRKYVGRAMASAARGGALTRQLLAFARRQPLSPVVFDVAAKVAGLAELLRGVLGRMIALQVTAPEGLWPVEADPNQLDSALLNLAINARDAMPQGGSLSIVVSNVVLDASMCPDNVDAGDFVEIAVADTGVGMSAETLRLAFDPFFTTKATGQGSGLGLSQVYGFVSQSRGHVTLTSEPGKGTVVTLYLPRAAPTVALRVSTSDSSLSG